MSSYFVEEGVFDCFSCSNPLGVINFEHLRKQVKGAVVNQIGVALIDELLPGFLLKVEQVFLLVLAQLDVLKTIDILVNFLRANYLCNLDELIIIVSATEEGLLCKNHPSKHAASAPNVKRVVIVVVAEKQFGRFEVPAGDTHVESLRGLVEVSQTPINNRQTSLFSIGSGHALVHENIARLDVAMDDSV